MKNYHDEHCEYESDAEEIDDPDGEYDELKENRQLHYIGLFKIDLRKSPVFIGLDNISAFDILCLIKTREESLSMSLEYDEMIIFDDIYYTLFGTTGTRKQYEHVSNCIKEKIYV